MLWRKGKLLNLLHLSMKSYHVNIYSSIRGPRPFGWQNVSLTTPQEKFLGMALSVSFLRKAILLSIVNVILIYESQKCECVLFHFIQYLFRLIVSLTMFFKLTCIRQKSKIRLKLKLRNTNNKRS